MCTWIGRGGYCEVECVYFMVIQHHSLFIVVSCKKVILHCMYICMYSVYRRLTHHQHIQEVCTMYSTTGTPTHRYTHIHVQVWGIMRSYRIDKEVTDADAQEKWFADVLIGEVFLFPLILTCKEGILYM